MHTGECTTVRGTTVVPVEHNGQTATLPLVIQQVPDRHSSIFSEGLGELRAMAAKIHVGKNACSLCHKARQVLLHIFNESKATLTMASGHIQRRALTLGAYHYTIHYKEGKENANADALSSLPLTSSNQ